MGVIIFRNSSHDHILWPICLICVFIARGGLCAEETFSIKLDRPRGRVGQELQISAESHAMRITISDSKRKPRATNYTSGIELLGHGKVLAAGPSMEMRIERLIESNGKHSAVLLPRGTVVIGKRLAGETLFTVGGKRLPVKVSNALAELTDFGSSGSFGC